MPSTVRRWWLVLWRILGVAGDLHFGWSMLRQYVLPSGAGAVLLTALLDYVSGFGDYLTESPWLFRWAVYVSVFILIFVALNHLITLGIKAYHRSQARRRSTPTQPPSTTTYNIENVLMGGHKQKEEQNIERLATEERRKAVKLSLAHAALVGELLHNDKPTTEQYESWSNVVAVMIW